MNKEEMMFKWGDWKDLPKDQTHRIVNLVSHDLYYKYTALKYSVALNVFLLFYIGTSLWIKFLIIM